MGSVPRSQGLCPHLSLTALFPEGPQQRVQQTAETQSLTSLLSFEVLNKEKKWL